MNCKKGDLAIRVSNAIHGLVPVGAIVTVVEYIGGCTNVLTGEYICDVWEIEWNGQRTGLFNAPLGASDAELRPIRDSDGEDETLTWAGKPEQVSKPGEVTA
jgi:hypothetical protein